MQVRELVISFYEYFYSRVTGNNRYSFKPTNSEISMIDNFIKLMGGGIGKLYLFKYFSYQFYYWHDKETRFGKGKVQLNWVIGKKAYERYDIKKEEHWYSYSTDLGLKFGIYKSDLIPDVQKSDFNVVKLLPHEDIDRMLHLNTEEGLILCIDLTSMWHPKSKACSICINVDTCKLIMKDKYSMVYNLRAAL